MTQDDIIRMAREAGIRGWHKERGSWFEFDEERLLRFAALVAAHERGRTKDPCNPLQDLTDDEITELYEHLDWGVCTYIDFARAVIAAYKEKNK